MITISVARGPDEGQVYKLPPDEPVLIGRRNGHVPLNDTRVSKQHAEIRFENGQFVIADLNSSNGTYVNRRLVRKPTPLSDGDRIRLGRTKLLFTTAAGAAARQRDDDDDAAFDISDLAEVDDLTDSGAREGTGAGAPAAAPVAASAAVPRQLIEALARVTARLDAVASQHEGEDVLHEILHLLHDREESQAAGAADAQSGPNVGEEIAATTRKLDAVLEALEARQAQQAQVDAALFDALQQMQPREGVDERLDSSPAPNLDISHLEHAIDQLNRKVEAWAARAEATAAAPPTQALDDQTEAQLNNALAALSEQPQRSAAIESQLATLAAAIDELRAKLAQSAPPAEPTPPQTDPRLEAMLGELRAAVEAGPKTDAKLEALIRQLIDKVGDESKVDLASEPAIAQLRAQIDALKDRLESLPTEVSAKLASDTLPPAPAPAPDERIGAILEAVTSPRKDDEGEAWREALAAIAERIDVLTEAQATAPRAPDAEQLTHGVRDAVNASLADLVARVDALAAARPDDQAKSQLATLVEHIDRLADAPTPQLRDIAERLDSLAAQQQLHSASPAVTSEDLREAIDAAAKDTRRHVDESLDAISSKLAATGGGAPDEASQMLLSSVLARVEQISSREQQAHLVDAIRQAISADVSSDARYDEVIRRLDALATPDPRTAALDEKLDLLVDKAAAEAQLAAAVDERLGDVLTSVQQLTGPAQREQIAEAVRDAVARHIEQTNVTAAPDTETRERLDAILEAVTAPPPRPDVTPDPRIDDLRESLAAITARLDALQETASAGSAVEPLRQVVSDLALRVEQMPAALAQGAQVEQLRQAIEAAGNEQRELAERVRAMPDPDAQAAWFERVIEAIEANSALQNELRSSPSTDEAVRERLDEVLERVRAAPQTPPTDPALTQTVELLENLTEAVTAPRDDKPLADLSAAIAELRDRLDAVAAQQHDDAHHAQTVERLQAIEDRLAGDARFDQVLEAVTAPRDDSKIETLSARLTELAERIDALASTQSDDTKQTQTIEKLAALEAKLASDDRLNLVLEAVTAEPDRRVEQKLAEIEARLDPLAAQAQQTAMLEQIRDLVAEKDESRMESMLQQVLGAVHDRSEQAGMRKSLQQIVTALRTQHQIQQQTLEALKQLATASGGEIRLPQAAAAPVVDVPKAPPRSRKSGKGAVAPVTEYDEHDSADHERLGAGVLASTSLSSVAADASVAPIGTPATDSTAPPPWRRLVDRAKRQPVHVAISLIGIAALVFIIVSVIDATRKTSTDPGPATPGPAASTDGAGGDTPKPPDVAASAQQDKRQVDDVLNAVAQRVNPDGSPITAVTDFDMTKVQRVAFVLDVSGLATADLPRALEAIENPMTRMTDQQEMTLILFTGEATEEVGVAGLKKVTKEAREATLRSARIAVESMKVEPVSNPGQAIRMAMRYKPDMIWLLSTNIAGDNPKQMSPSTLLEVLDYLNDGRKIHINTTQLLKVDPQGTMRRIAEQHGGTYFYFGRDEAPAAGTGAPTGDPSSATSGADAASPKAWLDPQSVVSAQLDVEQLKNVVAHRRARLGDEHLDTLEAKHQLGMAMHREGQSAEAEAMLTSTLEALGREQGRTHPLTLAVAAHLAQVLADRGRPEDAETPLREVLGVRRQRLGEDHALTLEIFSQLAGVLEAQGKLPEAEQYRKAVLASMKKQHGDDHPDTLLASVALAGTLEARGQLQPAEQMRRDVLTAWRKQFGPDDPGAVERMFELAHLLRYKVGKLSEADDLFSRVTAALVPPANGAADAAPPGALARQAAELAKQSRFSESQRLHLRAIDLARRALGADHRVTLQWRAALAQPLVELDRQDEARRDLEQVIAQQVKVLGEDHDDAQITRLALAKLLRHMKQYDAAAEVLAQVVDVRRRVRGVDNADTIEVTVELADTLALNQKLDEALALQQFVLKSRQLSLGDDHALTLLSMSTVGRLLRDLGRFDEALDMQKRVVDITVRVHGEEDASTLASMHMLALAQQERGHFADAEATHRRVLELRTRTLGERHRDTLASMAALTLAMREQGKYVEALPLYRKLVDARKEVLGPTHLDTLAAMDDLAVALHETAEDDAANELLTRVIEIRRNLLGDHDRRTLASMSTLAMVLEAQDRLNEAEPLRRLVLALCKAHLGEKDAWSVAATHHLALLMEKRDRKDDAQALLHEAVDGYHLVAAGKNVDPQFVRMLREGVAACRRVLGDQHPDTLRSQTLLTQVESR